MKQVGQVRDRSVSLELPQREYGAAIFDLDGTLVDSMPVHFRAWQEALAKQGAAEYFLEPVFYENGGRSAEAIVADLNSEHGLDLDAVAVVEAKREAYARLVPQGVPRIREVVEFVLENQGRLAMAVATGSRASAAELTLRAAGLRGYFEHVVTPADVESGKPAPDMFLLAAERLGVAPGECVVFEDAPPGIAAAEAAGMDCVVVPGPELPVGGVDH